MVFQACGLVPESTVRPGHLLSTARVFNYHHTFKIALTKCLALKEYNFTDSPQQVVWVDLC